MDNVNVNSRLRYFADKHFDLTLDLQIRGCDSSKNCSVVLKSLNYNLIRRSLRNVSGQNKISLTGCKWSSLNAPRSETPVSHSFLESSLFQFSAPAPSFLPFSGVIRINGLLWEAG